MARKSAARRAAAKAKAQDGCEVTGCVEGRTLYCCDGPVCKECVLNSLLVRLRRKSASFVYSCPHCGKKIPMPSSTVKELMGEYCPSHAQVMDQRSRGKAVVAHCPCPSGCYDCDDSRLEVREL